MSPLPDLPPTPASHFALHCSAALHRLRRSLPDSPPPPELAWLQTYWDELQHAGIPATTPHVELNAHLTAWEACVAAHLPIRAVATAANLDPMAMSVLFAVGLVEEDGAFAAAFDALQGAGLQRPTAGLLAGWFREPGEPEAFRAGLRRLLDLGLVRAADEAAPRSRRPLEVAPALWDALRGDRAERPAPWARLTPVEQLPDAGDLVLSDDVAAALATLGGSAPPHGPAVVIVRGAPHSGRRTVLAALARRLGRAVLTVEDAEAAGRLAGPLAAALDALPLVVLEPGPGEAASLPPVGSSQGPLLIALGRRGRLAGEDAQDAVELTLGLPDVQQRTRHWLTALPGAGKALAVELAAGHRLGAGTIHRLGRRASAQARLRGAATPTLADVAAARRSLDGDALGALARRVEPQGDWDDLAVDEPTARELELLERRCRCRETLPSRIGSLSAPAGPGVRALFSGPSGTGKSMAAGLLASTLGKDLHVLDLSTVVDKYLGETEKNLEAAFSRAEELDVVLLLDEGDALLAGRTDVGTSNDRYANLETNFLLQRLESYEGIVVVTTNAPERIDQAFKRRLDVVVEFRRPDAALRWSIWQRHLPQAHAVDDHLLDEVAARCELTGGQIRNAVIHAALLALDGTGAVSGADLEDAVRREYRKAGAVCPLRAPVGAHG